MIEAIGIAVAVAVVVATRGSFHQLARLELRIVWLLFLAVGIQVGLGLVSFPRARVGTYGFALLTLSYALLAVFCAANLRHTGMSIVLIGVACNLSVIAVNHGMPYRAPAAATRVTTVKHRPERARDALKVLDDRIILPSPLDESISFGDLILTMGLIDVIYRASRPARGETSPRRSAAAA